MKKLLVIIGLKLIEAMGLCLIFLFSYVIGWLFYDHNDFWLNGLIGLLFILGGILLFMLCYASWRFTGDLLKRKKGG